MKLFPTESLTYEKDKNPNQPNDDQEEYTQGIPSSVAQKLTKKEIANITFFR
jgi:hypothetical protein